MEYSYPISLDWKTEEIIDVIQFFEAIEQVYNGSGIKKDTFQELYKKFKTVVPSIGEERRILREFEEVSGFSGYCAVQKMKAANDSEIIKL